MRKGGERKQIKEMLVEIKRNRETEQKNKGHLTRRWKDKFKSGQRRTQRGQAGRGGEGEEVSHDSNISMWPAVCVCLSVCV